MKYRVFVAVARLLEGAGTHPIAAFTMCQVHETSGDARCSYGAESEGTRRVPYDLGSLKALFNACESTPWGKKQKANKKKRWPSGRNGRIAWTSCKHTHTHTDTDTRMQVFVLSSAFYWQPHPDESGRSLLVLVLMRLHLHLVCLEN